MTEGNRHETEVKIRITENEIPFIRSAVARQGFRLISESTLETNWLFDFPDGRLKASGCALRLRRYGTAAALTFKGPKIEDPDLKIRREDETPVEDPGAARRILEQLGLSVSFRYDKEREKFRLDAGDQSVELCIDQTPFGSFIEIEGPPTAILELAHKLGRDRSEFLTASYVDLYAEQGLGN